MKKGWLIGIIALVLLAGGAAGAAYAYGKDDRLPAGFSAGGLVFGGQSAAAAIDKLQSLLTWEENRKVSVKAPEEVSDGGRLRALTLKQLGMRVSADEAMQAMEAYRDESWWGRAKMRLLGNRDDHYLLTVTWDDRVLKREAEKAWGGAAGGTPPRDAKREITQADEVVYTPEVVGTKVDLETLAKQVKQLAPGADGLAAPGSKTENTLKLPIVKTVPKVTVASLKEEGIERKIAEFTTSFVTSAAGRSHNVTVAAKALNDTLLQPDEVFEYGKIVDKAEKEYGYREAPVIVKGKLTPGIGGGICQVSSTLYNAILQAGLQVVERRNHSIAVHYLPPGLDATFADGYINFRFRNTTGKQLLIRTVVQDKHVTVKLFGTLDENVSYRTETNQLKEIAPQIKYVGNKDVAIGQQKTLQKGESGYVVDTYRIKLVDGKEVSRERLPRSSYRAQDELIAVNPADARLNPPDSTPPPSGDEGPVEPV